MAEPPYGGKPPFQKHSETSKDAADSVESSASSIRNNILVRIIKSPDGYIRDEIEVLLDLPMQTVSPRFCELEAMGLIVNTGEKRKTRRGRYAFVYIDAMRAPKPEPEPDPWPAVQTTLF